MNSRNIETEQPNGGSTSFGDEPSLYEKNTSFICAIREDRHITAYGAVHARNAPAPADRAHRPMK